MEDQAGRIQEALRKSNEMIERKRREIEEIEKAQQFLIQTVEKSKK